MLRFNGDKRVLRQSQMNREVKQSHHQDLVGVYRHLMQFHVTRVFQPRMATIRPAGGTGSQRQSEDNGNTI